MATVLKPLLISHYRNLLKVSNVVACNTIRSPFERRIPDLVQVANMSVVNKRRTRRLHFHPVPQRVLYPEHMSDENVKFVDELVKEEYEYKTRKVESLLQNEPWARGAWAPNSQRVGLIGTKIAGFYRLFRKTGKPLLTTAIQIADNHVVKYIPPEELLSTESDVKRLKSIKKNPRGALIVGSNSADPRFFTKGFCKMFEEAGVMPKKKLAKFVVSNNAVLQPGTPLYATHFRPGDYIDVCGFTIDQGYQGVVKRWGFKGGPASHGCTKFHRRPGYIGCGLDKVMRGKKMPGHMGLARITCRGREIVRINTKENVIWVNGKLPGTVGGYLLLYDSGLMHRRFYLPEDHPPFPTHYPADDPIEKVDLYGETVYDYNDDTIIYKDDEAESD